MKHPVTNAVRPPVVAARRSPRRGVVYVVVMGAALIISLMTLAALHIVRIELRATGGLDRMTAAQDAADAAIELAIARIRADSSWRTTYTSGQEWPQNSWLRLDARAKLKFILIDDDGNLADDDRDPVTVRGVGSVGDAVMGTSVILEPSGAAITCLEAALHAHGDVTIASGTTVCDQFVSSNDDVNVGYNRLESDVWAVDDINTSSFLFNQGVITGVRFENSGTPREMPDAAHVLKYYLANGTWIDVSSIPNRTISQVILSAANNPFGAKNPQGIYVIDCGSQQLKIADCRIKATVVVLSTATTLIEGAMNWEPPAPNQPSLLVTGNLNMRWNGGSTVTGALFGLIGIENNVPGVIKGLTYVGGDYAITSACILQGPIVVAGSTTIDSAASITYDGAPYNFPPHGFSKGAVMRVLPGTWQRTTHH